MLKKRLITTPDYGKSFPYGQYSGERLNYPVIGTDICPINGEAMMIDRFYHSPKDLLRGPHPTVFGGEETFWSTDFHKPVWNDCIHTKVNASFNYPYAYIKHGLTGWPGMNIAHASCYRFGWMNTVHDPVIKETCEIDQFFRSRAIATMRPTFESDFQALNFMFELKDFKELFTLAPKLFNPGSDLWRSIYNWNIRFGNGLYGEKPVGRKRPPRGNPLGFTAGGLYTNRATNALAKSWLTYTMAYVPLIKDIAAYVAAAATEYKDALQKFKADGLNLNTRHYSEYLVNNSHVSNEVLENDYFTAIKHESFVRATANLRYRYIYTLTDETEAFARYWGLTGTLEEFWNMLPGTFLVDYFCKIAKALKMTDVDKNLDFQPAQYCESLLTYEGTTSVVRPCYSWTCNHMLDGDILDASSDEWVRHTGVYSSLYRRNVMDVPMQGIIIPRFTNASKTQRLNMLALAKTVLF